MLKKRKKKLLTSKTSVDKLGQIVVSRVTLKVERHKG